MGTIVLGPLRLGFLEDLLQVGLGGCGVVVLVVCARSFFKCFGDERGLLGFDDFGPCGVWGVGVGCG